MRSLRSLGLCSAALLSLALVLACAAAAAPPTWYACAKATGGGSGHYTDKTCAADEKVEGGGKYELVEGLGKGKSFKGKGRLAVLDAKTLTGSLTVECAASKSSGTPSLPGVEGAITISFQHCKGPAGEACGSAGLRGGEIRLAGLKGTLSVEQESPLTVGLALESESHPGPEGLLAAFSCEGLEASLKGSLAAIQREDVDVVQKAFEIKLTSPVATEIDAKGEALMVNAAPEPKGSGGLLIGEVVEHVNGGDSKAEEITPLKFKARESGTVEEIHFEGGGYLPKEAEETSLVLGISEQNGTKPGKVLGEGTYVGKLAENQVATVSGLDVPIVAGRTYYLDFLPLGGTVTYWFSKAESVIYSTGHKKLTEGPPEDYEYKTEKEEAPIGEWATGK